MVCQHAALSKKHLYIYLSIAKHSIMLLLININFTNIFCSIVIIHVTDNKLQLDAELLQPETRYLVWISTNCQEKYTSSENTVQILPHTHTTVQSQFYKTFRERVTWTWRQKAGGVFADRQIV